MNLVYPRERSVIFIPRELYGSRGNVVFQAAHRKQGTTIFWHLDGEFLGQTSHFLQLAISPYEGNYTLTLVDATGDILLRTFRIAGPKSP